MTKTVHVVDIYGIREIRPWLKDAEHPEGRTLTGKERKLMKKLEFQRNWKIKKMNKKTDKIKQANNYLFSFGSTRPKYRHYE